MSHKICFESQKNYNLKCLASKLPAFRTPGLKDQCSDQWIKMIKM